VDSLLVMFEACTDSPAYMRLDSEQEAAAAVLSIMGDNPELEELVNAHTYTAKQEGFVNGSEGVLGPSGIACAGRELRPWPKVRNLRVVRAALPIYRGLPLVCCGGVWALYRPGDKKEPHT